MDLKSLIFNFWQPALFSFLLLLGLMWVALKLFPKWGLMDRPHKYGLNRKPIPYYGGLVIFLAFIVTVLLFAPLTQSLIIFLIAGTMILLVGFFDDLLGLSPIFRLLVQFLAGLLLVYGGIGIYSVNLPFLGTLEFYDFWPVFTVLWVMAIINTMNFIDGVPGLNSGVSFIAALTIFFLSVNPIVNADLEGQAGVAILALVLATTSFGFLLFDFPRPKILMGDTGSTFLGFSIATLAIFSGGKVATAFLVLGLPILDMLWVVLRRLWAGQRIWKGDLKHLHHRFLEIGFSDRKVVLLYLSITAVFGLTAVVLVSSQQKFFMMIALGVLMLLLALALVLSPRKN